MKSRNIFLRKSKEIFGSYVLPYYLCVTKANEMKAETINIIGYTDSINECDCCGKTDLRGTYCMEIDGEEFYYGGVCAFKNHGLTVDDQKELKASFTKEQKNKKLYDIHIAPLKAELTEKLNSNFAVAYESLTGLAKKLYDQMANGYDAAIEYRMKKYKISN